MALITGSLNLEDLADCDLVIEAVFERMDIKKDVFAKLDKIVKQGAVLATNTALSQHRRDRERDEAAGIRDRHALLLAGQCDEAAGESCAATRPPRR